MQETQPYVVPPVAPALVVNPPIGALANLPIVPDENVTLTDLESDSNG